MVDFNNMEYNEVFFYYDYDESYKVIFIKENPWIKNEYIFVFKNAKNEFYVESISNDSERYFYKNEKDFLDKMKEKENERYKRIYSNNMG